MGYRYGETANAGTRHPMDSGVAGSLVQVRKEKGTWFSGNDAD